MIRNEGTGLAKRNHKQIKIQSDLVIVGGGMSGICSAITAARAGIKVTLVTDRPVLGGNASSEVRLWILGATSHMGNNNRWSREGGVIDEILVENLYRNKEGNTLILDTILLEKVVQQTNITLLLNTSVYELDKKDPEQITSVTGFCSINATTYVLSAPLFCDASGDGVIGFLAGAAFRMGAESSLEFAEKLAAPQASDELLGHSMYFYSKDIGKPVKYIPPSFAITDITKIPRYRDFKAGEDGCRLWWLEYGGNLDTVYDSEEIKWELWRIIYGVWDYIKNSGNFQGTENLTLEWVSTIPGKRESRRFEGDYILKQADIVGQAFFDDAVAHGGWAIDLHPSQGIYSERPGCSQWHSKGVYQIPYRCLYSKNIKNLFLAGRIISTTHVAHGSTRVMATCAATGQAVGMAAALCIRHGLLPSEIRRSDYIQSLQTELLRAGHYIPQVNPRDTEDLVQQALLSASSELTLDGLSFDGPLIPLEFSTAQMLPVTRRVPSFTFEYSALENTRLQVELRVSSKAGNHTPDVLLETIGVELTAGTQRTALHFSASLSEAGYAYICFIKNPLVSLRGSAQRVTGLLSLYNSFNKAVSNLGFQEPPEDIGVDTFAFWCPQRRPGGHNIAFTLGQEAGAGSYYQASNIANGPGRPVSLPNAWTAARQDADPVLHICWTDVQPIKKILIFLDTDYDHPLESSLLGHPESVIPFCLREYELRDDRGQVIYQTRENHQSVNHILFETPVHTKEIHIHCRHPDLSVPAAIFQVRCYAH